MDRPPSMRCTVEGHHDLCSPVIRGDLVFHGHGTTAQVTSVWWQRPSGEMVRIDQGFDALIDVLNALAHVQNAEQMDAWCKVRGLT